MRALRLLHCRCGDRETQNQNFQYRPFRDPLRQHCRRIRDLPCFVAGGGGAGGGGGDILIPNGRGEGGAGGAI
ncbi:hypothetical protein U1Q18_031648 [Sarracenia purpurea var. burkii]